jgi:hypothetical protein
MPGCGGIVSKSELLREVREERRKSLKQAGEGGGHREVGEK